jgi:hypothetical protein
MCTSSDLKNETVGLLTEGAFLAYEFDLNSPFQACFSLLSFSTSNKNAFVLSFNKPEALQTIKLV